MAEQADAQDLGSCAFGRGGSTPPPRTTKSAAAFDLPSQNHDAPDLERRVGCARLPAPVGFFKDRGSC